MPHRSNFHRPFLAALLAAAVMALALAPGASAGQRGCGRVNALAGQASIATLKRSTLCLLNRQRVSRGMRPLQSNRRLARAATGHALDMVRRRYFSHDTPEGSTFVQRILRTGYLRRVVSWTVGENLAWGSYNLSTPASIVRAWMASPGHRANILNSHYRQIGIGVVVGAPEPGVPGPAATYATEFGRISH